MPEQPANSDTAFSTLLDEEGHLAHPVSAATLAAWKQEIHSARAASLRTAGLHVWLGEWELAENQQPEKAIRHFQMALRLTCPISALYGLAAYDTAIAEYYEGAYQACAQAFHRLLVLKTALPGYDRKACALWYRHAAATAGYHLERAHAGIPEPLRLDPLCAAASLAASLKGLVLPADKQTVLSHMHIGGEGSNLNDILVAAKKLGVSAYPITADDQGLMALPKPAISFVERDHFLSVIKADKHGVSYLCSDCGAWPGGQVKLSWKQWHLLEPTGYVVVCRPGSAEDKALQMLAHPRAGIRMALQGPLTRLHLSATRQALSLLQLLKGHVFLYLSLDQSWNCGGKPPGQNNASYAASPMDVNPVPLPAPIEPPIYRVLPAPIRQAPSNNSDPPSLGILGPTSGARTNMATGEEELSYSDLLVYNPIGPSVNWSRLYDSLRPPHASDLPSGFGLGWSDPYNVGVFITSVSQKPPSGPLITQPLVAQGYYEQENSARVNFTCNLPTSSNPKSPCILPQGADFVMECDFDSSNSSTYFTLTFADRSQIITRDAYTGLPNTVDFYPPAKIVDRNGNYDQLNYNTPRSGQFPALQNIADSSGSALLTINYSGGYIASVSDRYNRSVYYQGANYQASGTYWETTQVSQIVTTGTSNPPAHWSYGYTVMAYNQAPSESGVYLNTITMPSPTGTGTSTATINYDPNTNFVSSIVDANGNSRNYSAVDANHTKVTVEDSQQHVVTSYTLGFDNKMNPNSQTDGTNATIVWSALYTDPNDPYRPSSVTNGNNDTWSYTWDQYGNIQTETTPRNTKTSWTWSYSNFALGELTKYQEGSNLGSAAKSPTTYLYYEPSGLLKSITYPLPGTTGSTSTVTTSLVYDSLGNVTQITSPGNNASTSIVTSFNYTTDGSYHQADAIGEPLMLTNNLGKVMHFRFDARGNPTSFIDALGNEVDKSFNLADQITQINYPATGQTGSGMAYMLYSYL